VNYPLFKAIIFDMDGLILETESSYFTVWQQTTKVMGFTLTDEFCRYLSGTSFSLLEQELVRLFGKSFSFAKFCELSEALWRSHVEERGIAVKSGAKELLLYLQKQNIPYCLATNSTESNARECLQYAGIESLFELMVCGDHVEKPKPAADIFLQAASVLSEPIQNCWVVEDSLTGLLAAQRAGAFSVLVPSLKLTSEMQGLAGVVIDDLLELMTLLQSNNN